MLRAVVRPCEIKRRGCFYGPNSYLLALPGGWRQDNFGNPSPLGISTVWALGLDSRVLDCVTSSCSTRGNTCRIIPHHWSVLRESLKTGGSHALPDPWLLQCVLLSCFLRKRHYPLRSRGKYLTVQAHFPAFPHSLFIRNIWRRNPMGTC